MPPQKKQTKRGPGGGQCGREIRESSEEFAADTNTMFGRYSEVSFGKGSHGLDLLSDLGQVTKGTSQMCTQRGSRPFPSPPSSTPTVLSSSSVQLSLRNWGRQIMLRGLCKGVAFCFFCLGYVRVLTPHGGWIEWWIPMCGPGCMLSWTGRGRGKTAWAQLSTYLQGL